MARAEGLCNEPPALSLWLTSPCAATLGPHVPIVRVMGKWHDTGVYPTMFPDALAAP